MTGAVRAAAACWRNPRIPLLAIAATALLAFAAIMYLGRHLSTFLYDEWDFVLNRLDWNGYSFLRPHNEHLSAWPVLVFKTMFETVGLAPYWPYRAVVAAIVVLCGVLVFFYARPRIGAGWALVPAALTMIVGQGGEDIIWPFQIGFDSSVACGVGLLLCLDRGGSRSEWVGGALVTLALSSSSIGLAVLVTAIVAVAVRSDRAPRALRLLALPVVLYGAWYLKFHAARFKLDNFLHAPQYVADAAGGAAGALVGLDGGWYPALALALAALVAWRIVRPGPLPVGLVTATPLPVAFWVLIAIGRADAGQPTTSRYLLPGAVFVAVVVVEAAASWRPPPRAAWIGAALVLFTTTSHLVALRDAASGALNGFTGHVRAELGALELAQGTGRVRQTFAPDPVRAPSITAESYFHASASHGSPIGDPVRTIAQSLPGPRESADVVYIESAGLGVRPGAPPKAGVSAPRVLAAARGRSVPLSGCVRFEPAAPKATLDLELGQAGMVMRASGPGVSGVALRRWGPDFTTVAGGLHARVWSALHVPRDRDPTPWQVRIDSGSLVDVCGLARGG